MGISNEQYPTKDGAANIHYDEDDLVRVDAELTIGILRKLVYMNDFFRLNYKSEEAQEEKVQEDSSDDPIIEDEATPTKAINM
ncbi:hypothetical protein F2Q69_00054739 [Brassica cretica]|uniref:Uncharacterized protein n=1 Tax=Brassica cretica TaxID=69181 RepID=A0A8S9N0P0_BRACR|nr:hypothetical protein F2Q69_00054739 [Brassica cretica]